MVVTLSNLSDAEEFERTLQEVERWAASVGYKETDVNEIIQSVRNRKRDDGSWT